MVQRYVFAFTVGVWLTLEQEWSNHAEGQQSR